MPVNGLAGYAAVLPDAALITLIFGWELIRTWPSRPLTNPFLLGFQQCLDLCHRFLLRDLLFRRLAWRGRR